MAEDAIEAKNKTGSLKEKLDELSETNPDIKIKSNAEIVKPAIDNLRTAIGNLLTDTGNLKDNIDDVNQSLDDYVTALTEARKATTIDHIMTLVDAYHQGAITQEEFNTYVNESVSSYKNFEAGVKGTTDAFDGFINKFNGDGKLTLEETNALLSGTAGLAENGVTMGTQLVDAADGMSKLTQATQEGTIANGGWNVTAGETAGLLSNEMTTAVETITTAYDDYNIRKQAALDAEKEEIKQKEEYKAAIEEKQKVLDIYIAHIVNSEEPVEALKNIELMYGKDTATALKTSFKEKYNTFDVGYADAITLAEEWSGDIKACEEALNSESGEIATRRKDKILNAEKTLQDKMNTVTTGWTNQQIDEFAKMAEKSGLKLDDGFIQMLKSCNTFVEDSQGSFNQAGEFSSEGFKTGLNKILPYLDSMKTTTSGKGSTIGYNLSSGIATGISKGDYKAIDAAKEAVRKAIAAAKREGDIHSPSKKMAKQIGKPLAQGLGVGFEDEMPNVLKKVKKGIGNITVGVNSNSITAAKNLKNQSNNNLLNTLKSIANNKSTVTQNNTFTSKELTPYEQQVQLKRLNRDLAGVFA